MKMVYQAQEAYNIEGNSSNEMLRKNYLVDQFYGSDNLFSHYHLPGEGNLRGFVGSGERGAEAMIASTTEACLQKNLAKENQDPVNLEFVTFADAGIFFNRNLEDTYQRDVSNIQHESRFLANGGIGLRFGTKCLDFGLLALAMVCHLCWWLVRVSYGFNSKLELALRKGKGCTERT